MAQVRPMVGDTLAGETDGVEIVARRGRLVRGALTGWAVLMYVVPVRPDGAAGAVQLQHEPVREVPDHGLDHRGTRASSTARTS